MNRKFIFTFVAAAMMLAGCGNNTKGGAASGSADSSAVAADTVAKEKEMPDLVGDSVLTNTAHFYADKVDGKFSENTLVKAGELIKKDMADLREANFVYYPFSGPDFLYPYRLFPDADVYFLMGLEKPGSAVRSVEKSADKVKAYTSALSVYLNCSFFRTISMKDDLSSQAIDGTVPVIQMLMAKQNCQIISVKYKLVDEDGNMSDSEKYTMIAEIKFFNNNTPKHEQTLYYCSGNIQDGPFDPKLQAYLSKTLPKYKVVTFLKAASYLMHKQRYSKIRTSILDNSFAVLQDDSGIPYSFYKDGWDVTLYGKYKRPVGIFKDYTYQRELIRLYEGEGVKPLNFRIGYNNPSNWMCCRKKK